MNTSSPSNSAHITTRAQWRFLAALPVAAFLASVSASLIGQTAPAAKPAGEEIIKLEAFISTGSRFNNRTVT